MKHVIWSDLAELDYEENIEYLLKELTVSDAVNFVDGVERCINLVKTHYEIFPDREGKGYRSAVIVPAITMYYTVEVDHIRLHRFWNNNNEPKLLRL